MSSPSPARPTRRLVLGLLAGAPLAACVTETQQTQDTGDPSVYGRLDQGASLDQGAALSLVNGHRSKAGLAPLKLDPALSAEARQQAVYVASSDTSTWGQVPVFAVRRSSGTGSTFRLERVSAGYRTLAEAFSGWRDSPKHNELMLAPQAKTLGIAAVDRPGTKYRVYWVMIVAG
jgi:uncharacterized protein YkwD